MTSRDDLREQIKRDVCEIIGLFEEKNESYGTRDDAFHNFRSSALRIYGSDSYNSMFKVLLTLMDKHLVALANNGIKEKQYQERLRDIIVYSLIAMAMGREIS
jgi:hypothetical protein